MTKKEYDQLQEALKRHLKYAHGYSGNKAEVFREAIRVAMSMLHQMMEYPIDTEN